MLQNKRIVVTRSGSDAVSFKKRLEHQGAHVYMLPAIKTISNVTDPVVKNALMHISAYTWIIFTSTKGVDFFLHGLKTAGIDKEILQRKKIAVVGKKTAQKVMHYHLPVHILPDIYTNNQLVKEIKQIQGQKILLPRGQLGSKKFAQELQTKGAIVTDIPLYKTIFIQKRDLLFEDFVKKEKINYITFTSPSTIMGFLERVKEPSIQKKICAIPVFSIGPVTTKTAQKQGFLKIFTADIHTTNGMITKLQEIL